MIIENFKRMEKKYLLTKEEYNSVLNIINEYIEKDKFFESKICNIYFDTDNSDLIVRSLEKPEYKEKVRLRSYDVPGMEDKVFFEIKKKYKGVVGKRRITLKLKDFYNYLNGIEPTEVNEQILKELEYAMGHYKLKPKLFLAYDRHSYFAKEDKNLRITFDENVRSREDDLKLEMGDAGKLYFNEPMYIMEIKTLGSYPMWLVHALNDNHIYPASFSKYRSIYERNMKEEKLYV